MKEQAYIGIVTSYGERKGTVRVTRYDKDGRVSAELPVIQTGCAGNKNYMMPKIGESVLVLNTNNAGAKNIADGYVIGSYYNEVDNSEQDDQKVMIMKNEDGSYIKFDGEGNIEIHATGNIKITVGGKVTVDKC